MISAHNSPRRTGPRIPILLLLLLIAGARPAATQYRVIGYYPSWQRSTVPAGAVEFQYLTHINQAFAWPLADGSITGYSDLLYPELVATAHNAGRKVLISLGGWGNSSGFAPVAADSVIRARFAGNLVLYLMANGFDGADIDWEYPSTAIERANLVKLVRDIRNAFDEVDSAWFLTMAVPSGNWSGQWFDFAAMTPSIDWYNVMTYDTHGSWTDHAGHNSPLYAPGFDDDGSVDQAVKYIRGRGIPNDKIVIGIPFYGKEFTADSLYQSSTACVDITYQMLPARLAAGWIYHWDDLSKVPYLTMLPLHHTVCYDDSLSVTLKCTYARDNSLGGVMIWALGQDVIAGTQPLMEAIGKVTMDLTGIFAVQDAPVPERTQLFQNYPNPFNPTTTIRFSIPPGGGRQPVRLEVVDMLGRNVALLVNEELSPGTYERSFNANALSSGVYVCRLAAAGQRASLRMAVVR